MKRYAVCVEYDGSHYKGWQKQKHAVSVQQVLEQAVSVVANETITVICAGRTDTGVHGTGQVIHFDTMASRAQHQWERGINSNLPSDVCVHWVHHVDDSFHARFSALQRHYRYIIYNSPVRPSILAGHVSWFIQPLDTAKMQQASVFLSGTHDFSSFRASGCQAKSPVRTIKSISIARSGAYLYLDICANAFLHHMVRNIAGVLMAVGSGQQAVDWVSELLARKDRSCGGVTAVPDGLYFCQVDYPSHYQLPPSPAPIMFQ